MRMIPVLVALLLIASPALAGDDPSIQGAQRDGIGQAMRRFIAEQQVKGKVLHYDAVAGELLQLQLDELHAGIVKKGDFYVSCADFVATDGRKFDIDFLVVPNGSEYRVNQALVHSVDAKKRKYHLEGSGLF